MGALAPFQKTPDAVGGADLDKLCKDFFELAESQLATMPPERRQDVIASLHATAESLRGER